MKTWAIDLAKQAFKFSAAHFLIFPDGSAERLHGHNYRVYVHLESGLSPHGLVIDFKMIKPLIRELVDELDEYWILPGLHPVLRVQDLGDGSSEITYQERRYVAPTDELIVLPVNNTSVENLASYLVDQLVHRFGQRFPEVDLIELTVAVEETLGQRGICTYKAD
jgi:6-pyruvoyltetrahydropterin/6-carboxytetrahydropterin synthase